MSRKRFLGGYHSCIFSFCSSSFHCYFMQVMASEAIRASIFSLARRQAEQAVECSSANELGQKVFLSSYDLDSGGQVGEREGFRSRPGIGTHASHILHIIGSFFWS